MGKISDEFVTDFMAALPEGWASEEGSTNRTIAKAIGDAIEKAFLRERAEKATVQYAG
jgi:hypothetical protein